MAPEVQVAYLSTSPWSSPRGFTRPWRRAPVEASARGALRRHAAETALYVVGVEVTFALAILRH
eukprot:9501016-Pyramimonas_sp.AAC.1